MAASVDISKDFLSFTRCQSENMEERLVKTLTEDFVERGLQNKNILLKYYIFIKMLHFYWVNLMSTYKYSKPYQASKVQLFVEIVNDFQPLTVLID